MNIPKTTKLSINRNDSISNREKLELNKINSKMIFKRKRVFNTSGDSLKISRQIKDITKYNSFISEYNYASQKNILPKIQKFSHNKENYLTNNNSNINLFSNSIKSNQKNQFRIIPLLNINKPHKKLFFQNTIFNKNNSTKNLLNLNLNQMIVKKESSSKEREKIISKSNTPQKIFYECYNPDNYTINKYYSFSQAGTLEDGTTKINQDSYIILSNIFNLNYNILGILDGHGNEGHLISQFIKDQIKSIFTLEETYISDKLNLKNKIDEELIYSKLTQNNFSLIKKIYKSFDQILLKENFNSKNSGTTCVLLFQISKHIICANTGDSRCILIKKHSISKLNLKKLYNFTYENLSEDHKPNKPEEKKRILEKGGEVHKSKNNLGEFEGVFRLYEKGENYPGLAVSRTIGDLDSKLYGNISDPDIIIKTIDFRFKCVILASDGLWDVINGNDIISEIQGFFHKKLSQTHYNQNFNFCSFNLDLAEILGKKAIDKWENMFYERDDISIVVGIFGNGIKNKGI